MKRRSWCCGNRTGFLQQTVCAGDRVFAASAFGGTAICAATAEVRANCRGIFSVGANGIREKSCAKESLWRSAWLCLAAATTAQSVRYDRLPLAQDYLTPTQDFGIWVSNNSDVNQSCVALGTLGNSGYPYGDIWTLNVTGSTSYRYIALMKTQSEYMYIEEF